MSDLRLPVYDGIQMLGEFGAFGKGTLTDESAMDVVPVAAFAIFGYIYRLVYRSFGYPNAFGGTSS
jgi:hypothetical protein